MKNCFMVQHKRKRFCTIQDVNIKKITPELAKYSGTVNLQP